MGKRLPIKMARELSMTIFHCSSMETRQSVMKPDQGRHGAFVGIEHRLRHGASGQSKQDVERRVCRILPGTRRVAPDHVVSVVDANGGVVQCIHGKA